MPASNASNQCIIEHGFILKVCIAEEQTGMLLIIKDMIQCFKHSNCTVLKWQICKDRNFKQVICLKRVSQNILIFWDTLGENGPAEGLSGKVKKSVGNGRLFNFNVCAGCCQTNKPEIG